MSETKGFSGPHIKIKEKGGGYSLEINTHECIEKC